RGQRWVPRDQAGDPDGPARRIGDEVTGAFEGPRDTGHTAWRRGMARLPGMSRARRFSSLLALMVAVAANGGCDSRSVAPPPTDGGLLADAATDLGAGGGACAVEAPAGGTVFEGSITINNAADAVAAQAYTEITGSLVMGIAFTGAVDLPRLRAVGGDVYAEGGGMTNLRAPNLASIGNDLWIYLVTELVEVDLRSLVTVGGRLW